MAMAGGIIWVIVVTWFLFYSLSRVDAVAAQGDIAEPTTAQIVMAYALAVIFALPGAVLAYYGFVRKRLAGGRKDDGVPR